MLTMARINSVCGPNLILESPLLCLGGVERAERWPDTFKREAAVLWRFEIHARRWKMLQRRETIWQVRPKIATAQSGHFLILGNNCWDRLQEIIFSFVNLEYAGSHGSMQFAMMTLYTLWTYVSSLACDSVSLKQPHLLNSAPWVWPSLGVLLLTSAYGDINSCGLTGNRGCSGVTGNRGCRHRNKFGENRRGPRGLPRVWCWDFTVHLISLFASENHRPWWWRKAWYGDSSK